MREVSSKEVSRIVSYWDDVLMKVTPFGLLETLRKVKGEENTPD